MCEEEPRDLFVEEIATLPEITGISNVRTSRHDRDDAVDETHEAGGIRNFEKRRTVDQDQVELKPEMRKRFSCRRALQGLRWHPNRCAACHQLKVQRMSQGDLPKGRCHVSPAIEKVGQARGLSPK